MLFLACCRSDPKPISLVGNEELSIDYGRFDSTLIAFDGNSLTDAFQGSRGGTGFPEYMMELKPWNSNGSRIHNFAAGGQTITDMLRDAATQLDPLLKQGKFIKTIIIYWETTNELFYKADPTDCFRKLKRYGQERKAAGWDIVIAVIDPIKYPNDADRPAPRSTLIMVIGHHTMHFTNSWQIA